MQTTEAEPEVAQLSVQVPEHRHAVIHRAKVYLDEDRANGAARKHLFCTPEHAVLSAFDIYLQNINIGDAVFAAEMVERVRLDLDCLASISLPAEERIGDAYRPDVEFGF